jgi:acetate kinase
MTFDLLTINTGSSSLKAALYRLEQSTETRVLTVQVERIDLPESRLHVADANGATLLDRRGNLSSHDAALLELFTFLHDHGLDSPLAAVGHRIVHGGHYSEPQLVSDEMIRAIEKLVPIDPEHLPQALSAIKAVSQALPALPQVACFDTAFHRRMPRVAQTYALPRDLWDAGVLRYGFHGLSYEYILRELASRDPAVTRGRVIVAHLGNGASMAAVRDGVGIDTTMGFTPTGGLMMGTRTGDLDPGVLLYLLQARGLSPDALNDLVNRRAGLFGVSGISADVQDLLAKEATDENAALAIALFCYQARKFLGALAAVLGGLDLLVFTAGIGEHAASVRQRICAGLEFLGIRLDQQRNLAQAPIISRDDSPVVVRVMQTDEELMIARHTFRVVAQRGGNDVSL